MREVIVFTDGACSGNPGPGGWAAILLWPDGRVREMGGKAARTTNNRMELLAALSALRALSDRLPIRIYTDSTYLISGVTSWLASWKRKGWRTFEGRPVLNRDLWEELDALLAGPKNRVSWHYVRGHSGAAGNERCDRIAVSFAQGRGIVLYSGRISGYPFDLSCLPRETALPRGPLGPKAAKGGGYYLSLVAGRLERHATWGECQARVLGRSGARFKKVSSAEEEAQVLRGWGV